MPEGTLRRELTVRVRATLLERRLMQGASHVLVGCSGGPDSQALLSVLVSLSTELRFRVTAASVDHGLRPEAAAEVALVGQLAEQLAVPFVALRVRVRDGASRQAMAREARYAALLECARAHSAERVAVGHTLDDQAETVLARVLRGAGIEGLGAISPHRADGVIRPLVDCRRAQVHAYVAELGLPSALDPSNLDPRYLRVRVRHDLLPPLLHENPQLIEHLAHLADDAREAAALLGERASQLLAQAQGRAQLLREQPPLLRRWAVKRLVEAEAGVALTRAHVAALDRLLQVGGQVRVPGDLVVTIAADDRFAFSRVAKRGRGGKRPRVESDTP